MAEYKRISFCGGLQKDSLCGGLQMGSFCAAYKGIPSAEEDKGIPKDSKIFTSQETLQRRTSDNTVKQIHHTSEHAVIHLTKRTPTMARTL